MISQSKYLIVLLVALSTASNSGCHRRNNSVSTPRPCVTLGSFEQIRVGMSMEQASAVLGEAQDVGGVDDGEPRMKLAGVNVSGSARWNDDSSGRTREMEIGFRDGKVAVVIYRDDDVTKMKPPVAEGSFRVSAEMRSPSAMRVVVDIGAPETCLLAFGIGEAVDQLEGFEATTPHETTVFAVAGQLVDAPDADGKALEIVLERVNPAATYTGNFAIDDDKELSGVLAFDIRSRVYERGEPVVVGIITGQKGKKHRVVLHVLKTVDEPRP